MECTEIKLHKIFSQEYYKLCDLSKSYIAAHILNIFRSLGIVSLLREIPFSATKIIKKLSLHTQAEKPLKWMLDYMTCEGVFIRTSRGEYRVLYNKQYFFKSRQYYRKMMLCLTKRIRPFCDLTEAIMPHYIDFLKGTSGEEILFSKVGISLWDDFFSENNVGYDVFNEFGAIIATNVLSKKKSFNILELGGGSGGAACKLLATLKSANILKKLEVYEITDFSPLFLRIAQRNLSKIISKKKIRAYRLDFNHKVDGQRGIPSKIDLIYSVNALHAAKDVASTLKDLYQSLESQGALVLSECIRSHNNPFPFQELIFNLLESYRDVNLSGGRKSIGFLYPSEWKRLFLSAGFKNTTFITNSDQNSDLLCNAGVFVGVK